MFVWDWIVDFWTGPMKVWHMIIFLLIPQAISFANMRDQINGLGKNVTAILNRMKEGQPLS